jgi:hypothetical protein
LSDPLASIEFGSAAARVDTVSVHNWERGRSQPEFRYMPAIVRFPGDPLPGSGLLGGEGWSAAALGITQSDGAAHIGVDPGTLAHWERGEIADRESSERDSFYGPDKTRSRLFMNPTKRSPTRQQLNVPPSKLPHVYH